MSKPAKIEAPSDELSMTELFDTVWSFEGGPVHAPRTIAPVFVLRQNGLIGGYLHDNERRWDIDKGSLRLIDKFGCPTTIFDSHVREDGKLTGFSGTFKSDPTAPHRLTSRTYPAQPNSPTAPGDRRATIEQRLSGPKRRNLMIIRAGTNSLHRQWTQDIPGEYRNWDLMMSWYETTPPEWHADLEYLSLQPEYKIKWRAFYDLSHDASPLWDYDYICIADDDVMMTWRDINRLFEICQRNNLQLAQPSLHVTSYIMHRHTKQDPAYQFRYTDFVEGMAPVFSRAALRISRESFKDTVFGFGIDHLWPSLCSSVATQIAIIDEISMVHTRPMASRYNLQLAIDENHALLNLYRMQQRYRIFGGIFRDCDQI